jgi:hypothetical protein
MKENELFISIPRLDCIGINPPEPITPYISLVKI